MSSQETRLPQQRPQQQPALQRIQSPIPSVRTPNPYSPSSLEPPTKRQRLSPNPPSPYASNRNSPSITNASLPRIHSPLHQSQNQPWIPTPPLQQSRPQPHGKAEDMAQPQDSKVMGPPTKPEKAPDAQTLNDLVYASGIDLNEEEKYLAETYRNTQSFTSFNSKSSSTISANNSFNQLWNPSFTGQNTLQPPGSQPPPSQHQPPPPKTPAEIENDRHKAAARRLAEEQQHHLADPFLQLGAVRRTIQRRTYDNGVLFNMDGLYDPKGSHNEQGQRLSSVLNRDAPLGDLLALISLATNQRCRDILEDAYSVARGRQTSSDGVIPPEWSATATPVHQTQTIISTLKAIARADRSREESRIKKREQRAAARASATASEAPPQELVAPEVKMTKKERDRINKAGQTDEVLHQTANTTAKQFLGTKTYAWMNTAPSTPSFGAGSRVTSGTSTPRLTGGLGGGGAVGKGGGAGGGGAGLNPALVARQNRLGEWREDGEKGRGIQIRDWIHVLERDGREKKSLARAYVILLEQDEARSS